MAKISEYYEKKKLANRLTEELRQLEEDEDLKNEVEFKEQLNELMEKYGKTAKDTVNVLSIIDPKVGKMLDGGGDKSAGNTGRKRPLQVYRNPHTGEVVKTRGGNQKTLKAWRDQYGPETVRSWREE